MDYHKRLSQFVISLDFELFWGAADVRTVANYRNFIEGEWIAIPRMLALFQRYRIRATWATVGMLMCRNFRQWQSIHPVVLPGYRRQQMSSYNLGDIAREHQQLFFARPLVELILATEGQELGTHTYSHFYCDEPGAMPEQFAADLECARLVAADLGVTLQSIVFPRNQVNREFLAALAPAGLGVYRGNPKHWLYREGHAVPCGVVGRTVRYADAWVPISGSQPAQLECAGGLVNVPASFFLRPWSRRLAGLEAIRLRRLKGAMTAAAQSGGICHLWWHPQNFGVNMEQNIAVLESLLQHYQILRDNFGMASRTMKEAADQASVPSVVRNASAE